MSTMCAMNFVVPFIALNLALLMVVRRPPDEETRSAWSPRWLTVGPSVEPGSS